MLQYTMIETDNQIHLNRFKLIPPHPSYIAGLIDGDGCIFIRRIKDGYQSGFTLSQSRTNVLQVIRYHFGGSITTSLSRNKSLNIMNDDSTYNKYNVRNQFNLTIRSNEYQILLDYLNSVFIIKANQYEYLYEFNKVANIPNKNDEKESLCLRCSCLNQSHEMNDDTMKRLNMEYISGLFDAEGCFYVSSKKSKYYISITQKNNPQILVQIVSFLGYGCIDSDNKFKIYKKSDCLKFISCVKNHLIVKYNQATAFETYLTTNDFEVKKQMFEICNREKHESEIFKDTNQNKHGKDGYKAMIQIRMLKKKICEEICRLNFYKKKSENMKGELNHNFGKIFSEETKKKMSLSIRDSKGGVSDDVIIQVRQLHRPKRKMRQNVVMIYISYNYVSNNLLNVLLLFY